MSTSPGVSAIKNRDEAEAFLNDRIGYGVRPGLERIKGLLDFIGNPESTYPSVHVAGTNGKTTVTRMVQQILGAHGLATGGFTSPHLHRVEERFTLHGVTIDSSDFVEAVADIAWFVEAYERQSGAAVTYFEVTAALAFSIFATAAVDVAVVEVGLGGRLDATNVLDASVAVITGIDIDHTELLGFTTGAIAAEKVGILHSGGTLVSGPLPQDAAGVIGERVAQTSSKWIRSDSDFAVKDAVVAVGGWRCSIEGVFGSYDDLYLPLHGYHQVEHVATSLVTAEMFLGRELDHDSLEVALSSMTAPGRLEVVGRRPVVLLDGAHNVQGIGGLATTITQEFPAMEWQLVLGVRGDRDVGELVEPLLGHIGKVFATAPDDPGAIDPHAVAAAAAAALGVEAVAFLSPEDAFEQAREAAGAGGGVIVAGSLYLVGEVRRQHATVSDRSGEAHLRFEAERSESQGDADVDVPD